MKKMTFVPTLLALALLAAGCSSVPTSTSLLEQARGDYMAAQVDSNVAKYAAADMQRSTQALLLANQAATERESMEKIDKLAYLARQQIALTREVAKQKTAEAELAGAATARDQVRLEQRTAQADKAKREAEQAKLGEQIAQGETAQARSAAEMAQKDALAGQAKNAQLEAKLQEQLAELAAKKTERGIVITLGDVLFATDMATLSAAGMQSVHKLGEVLLQNQQRSVKVEGYTDSTGGHAHNMALSERRANAVKAALLEMGVTSQRVLVQGYGENHPVAGNDNAQDRQLNRRVEIILSDENGKIVMR